MRNIRKIILESETFDELEMAKIILYSWADEFNQATNNFYPVVPLLTNDLKKILYQKRNKRKHLEGTFLLLVKGWIANNYPIVSAHVQQAQGNLNGIIKELEILKIIEKINVFIEKIPNDKDIQGIRELKKYLSDIGINEYYNPEKTYKKLIDLMEDIETVIKSYFYIQGYNKAINIIIKKYDLEELSVFLAEQEEIEKYIQTFNNQVDEFLKNLENADYKDEEEKNKKISFIKHGFRKIDVKKYQTKERNLKTFKDILDKMDNKRLAVCIYLLTDIGTNNDIDD